MKQILIFATWWRHFSGQSIKIAFLTTNIAPPGGGINFLLHRSKPTWPGLSHAKTFFFDIFILVVFPKVLRGPKKTTTIGIF